MKKLLILFSGLAIVLLLLLLFGIIEDFRSFDRTKGGYEPPYTEYTGEIINWNKGDTTPVGFSSRGRVINTLLDCTTGMISFQIYGVIINFRTVSKRAIVVHKPREACIEKGFNPEF